MKKHFWLLVCACGLFLTLPSGATPFAYVSGTTEPWGQLGGQHAMDNVFGSGNWDRLEFSNAVQAGIFDGTFEYLYVDGSAGNTSEWEEFVAGNRAALESFVADGGSLFLNAARWGGTSGFDMGFDVSLLRGRSSTGRAADDTHAVFNGLTDVAGTDFVGSGFSHDHLIGAGLNSILLDNNERIILAEMDFGSGHAMFGGLTLAFYGENDYWSADTGTLRDNIIGLGRSEGASRTAAPIPEPSTFLLLCLGLIGIGLVRTSTNN